MSDTPLISVFCLAYNHALYIRKALDGFLMQETEYPFEILIHDDASTDGTADIIREYEKNYPKVLRPVYESENQYYKHDIFRYDILPHIRGKYIAHCEGDDYWTDVHKLQKQVSYMERHPDCAMTFHAANVLIEGELAYNDQRSEEECDYSAETMIEKGGTFCATASLCYKTEYARLFPKFREISPTGDYPLQVLMALCGRVHYFPDIMATHLRFHPGSWSVQALESELDVGYSVKRLKFFLELDRETHHVYTTVISKWVRGILNNLLVYTDMKIEDIFDIISPYGMKRWIRI